MANYQNALIGGIDRYLGLKGEPTNTVEPVAFAMTEANTLFVGPAPAPNSSADHDPEPLRRLVRKYDAAARDERNRALGLKGEELVFESEIARLRDAGRNDLAEKVDWISQSKGDGAGYDILSFTERGDERLLEVKTTKGYELTPFYLSANECALSEERPQHFRIFRLYDFAREPKAFEIAPPLRSALILETANYHASFS